MVTPELLRSIRRVEDLTRLTAALGYEAGWCELPTGSLGAGRSAGILATREDFTWFGVSACDGMAVRAARMLAGRGVPAAVLGLDEATRRITLAAGSTASLTLQLDAPDLLALARLARTAAIPGENSVATSFRIAEALDGRGADQRFFAGFRRVLDGVMAALPPGIPRVDRHALALLLLTRILFLYFVEARGWLAGRPRFLREEVDRCLASRRSLHRDLLRPLFFGTLNRPRDERSKLARRYGAIPFLNGGLFEPHPLERRWRVSFPTPVLRDAFDDFFERYHFTLATASGEAIAPDMLGRVFEGVMAPDERHSSGSYYTPAALVDAVLRDGIATWLSLRLRITWSDATARLDAPDPIARRALRGVRLLDPAVGSGAFLLGALRLLAGPGAPGTSRRAARIRRVLSEGLFGVDRNAAAVRLAELRLWLEVVAADPGERPESIAPLPNLDALVRQGDSLLDPTAGLPVPTTPSRQGVELASLRQSVVLAIGAAKRDALRSLRRAERRVAEGSIASSVSTLDARIAELLGAARSPTLFGGRRGLTGGELAALAELRAARRRARERGRALARADEVPWFSYTTQFADVLSRGGFDLVVGNPPWVRAESLAPDTRRYLAERFRWMKGARPGARGYAHQPDLAVAFLQRAFELSAPGAVVAFLVPAKLATTGYATTARAELARRTTIALAADVRDDPRADFDATVYPMALVAANAAPPPGHIVRLRLGAPHTAAGIPQSQLCEGPWLLTTRAVAELTGRLRQNHPALGEQFRPQLGVKTGLNRVFLDPDPEVEPELVRWAARGRDVLPFRVRRLKQLLWPYDSSGRVLAALPAAAARYLAPHLGELRRRADYAGGKPWCLFRTAPALSPHRVIWADVSRRLEATPLSGERDLEVIPLNSCYLTSAPDAETALRLAAWLNCTWCRALAAAIAEPASGGYSRFNARVVSALPLPFAVLESSDLLAMARRGTAGALEQKDLDACCAGLLSLDASEQRLLAGLAGEGAIAGR
jgi:hypothetical protein